MLTILKFSLKFVVVFSVLLLLEMQYKTINERLNGYSHRYCARSCLMTTLNWDLNDKNHTDRKSNKKKIPTHKLNGCVCVWVYAFSSLFLHLFFNLFILTRSEVSSIASSHNIHIYKMISVYEWECVNVWNWLG